RAAAEQAWALAQILDRYPESTLRALDEDARSAWSALVHTHVLTYQRQLDDIDHELRPVFHVPAYSSREWAPASHAIANAPASSRDLPSLGRELLQLDRTRDSVMQSAFAVSSDGAQVNALQTDAFWQLLRDARQLAGAVPVASIGNP